MAGYATVNALMAAASDRSFERAAEEPAALIGVMCIAVALFAYSAQSNLDRARREDGALAKLAFGCSCVLLSIALTALVVSLWFPAATLIGSAVLTGAVVGLLLIAVLGPQVIYAFVALLVLAIAGAVAVNEGAGKYVLGETRDPFLFRWAYAPLPANAGENTVPDPKSVALAVCDSVEIARAEAECGADSPRVRLFRLRELRHADVGFGIDVWFFVFRAPGETDPIVYLVSGDNRYIGTTRDPIDRSLRLEQNRIAGLPAFPDTALAQEVLDPMASEQGLVWAARGGIEARTVEEPRIWVAIVLGVLLIGTVLILFFATWRFALARGRKTARASKPKPSRAAGSGPPGPRRSKTPSRGRRSG
ncbi:MAG TPA: hypothetical protein VFT10_00880 [Solirubrobacterales bacterium]|nr:hypothetical protein [Solirubrobacterales bacterium]